MGGGWEGYPHDLHARGGVRPVLTLRIPPVSQKALCSVGILQPWTSTMCQHASWYCHIGQGLSKCQQHITIAAQTYIQLIQDKYKIGSMLELGCTAKEENMFVTGVLAEPKHRCTSALLVPLLRTCFPTFAVQLSPGILPAAFRGSPRHGVHVCKAAQQGKSGEVTWQDLFNGTRVSSSAPP